MRRFLLVIGLAVAVSLLLSACASVPGAAPQCDCKSTSGGDLRSELNVGYTLLYSAADGLARLDLVLYVKEESDAVQQVLEDVADYNKTLTARLEKIARDFPAIDIHSQREPMIELRTEEAARKARIRDLAPVVGKTGAQYERTLLLTLSGIFTYQRFLAQVMAEREPDPALKQILESVESRYIDLYDEVVKLLNARYFREDTYQPTPRG